MNNDEDMDKDIALRYQKELKTLGLNTFVVLNKEDDKATLKVNKKELLQYISRILKNTN